MKKNYYYIYIILFLGIILGGLFTSLEPHTVSAEDVCTVTSAKLTPFTLPTGSMPDNWYDDELRRTVSVTITTQHCHGESLYLSLIEGNSSTSTDAEYGIDKKSFYVNESEQSVFDFKAGEARCNAVLGNNDCTYFLKISARDYENTASLDTYTDLYNSFNKPQGHLNYECDTTCSMKWEIIREPGQPAPSATPNTTTTGACAGQAGCYEFFSGFADILGDRFKTISSGTASLGDFLNALIALFIAFMSLGLLGRIFYLGYKRTVALNSGDASSLKELRTKIWISIGGFVLLLSTFLILRTINPDLLILTPSLEGIEYVSKENYAEITGKELPTSGEISSTIHSQSGSLGPEGVCIATTLKSMETGPKRSVADAARRIGHDEDVRREGVPSRSAFINSGRTFKGASFSQRDVTAKIFNDDKYKTHPNEPGLGLDWRFSHGIGLFQITIFPNYEYNRTRGNNPVIIINNISYTARDLLDVEKNTKAMVDLFLETKNRCDNDMKNTFRAYNGGRCSAGNSTDHANEYAEKAYVLYRKCLGI